MYMQTDYMCTYKRKELEVIAYLYNYTNRLMAIFSSCLGENQFSISTKYVATFPLEPRSVQLLSFARS